MRMRPSDPGATLRHAVVIGQGVVGCATAIEAIRAGMRVTVVDPEAPGGEHAAS